jgi:hypothetical protein
MNIDARGVYGPTPTAGQIGPVTRADIDFLERLGVSNSNSSRAATPRRGANNNNNTNDLLGLNRQHRNFLKAIGLPKTHRK